jgi:hypothetical protein
MKTLLLVLVVATASLAVASVQFAHQASVQRKRADTEAQLRHKQQALVAGLQRQQAQLERELASLREQDTVVPPPVAAPPRAASAHVPSPAPATFGVVEAASPGAPAPAMEFRGRGPFETAAGRNFMRSRMKMSIRRLYGDAGAAMGLSPEKSNQLLDLIADQQTRNMGDIRSRVPEGQTIQQYIQDQQKKNNEEITALIGQDKADEWAAYQKSLPERSQLGMVRDQLEQAGVPMTESQRAQMLAAITEESQRLPRPTPTQGLPPEEMAAQYTQWQSDYDKALLDRAKQVLNTEQYNAYKEYYDWQTEMRASLPRPMPGGGAMIRGMTSTGNAVIGGPVVSFSAVAPAQMVPPPPPEAPRK